MVTVKLTTAQLFCAATVGVMRRVDGLKKGRRDRWGAGQGSQWDRDITGALCEYAAARWANRCWNGVASNDEELAGLRDVGDLFDARGITQSHHSLIIHPDDPDHVPFVLVHCRAPQFDLLGWLFARDGKDPAYWADPTGSDRAAYFVPQDSLRPMSELLEWLADNSRTIHQAEAVL